MTSLELGLIEFGYGITIIEMGDSQRVSMLHLEVAELQERQANLRKLNASLMEALSKPSEQVARLNKQISLMRGRHANEMASLSLSSKATQEQLEAAVQRLQSQLSDITEELLTARQAQGAYKQENQQLHRQLTLTKAELQNFRELCASQDSLISNVRRATEEQMQLQSKALAAELSHYKAEIEREWLTRLQQVSESSKQNEEYLRSTVRVLQTKLAFYQKDREFEKVQEKALLRDTLNHIDWGSFSLTSSKGSHGQRMRSDRASEV